MTPHSNTADLADRLLRLLRQQVSTPMPIEQLASELNSRHDQVHASTATIQEWGYRLKINESEITLESCPDLLNDIEIPYYLKTESFGQTIHAFKTVQSTNDMAVRLAEDGCPHGTIVVADQQTAGHGRHGRQWHSAPGDGVYVSIILRPKISPSKAASITIMTALALADTLTAYCPEQTKIKWPNDVLLDGRKIAGILAQLSADEDRVNHIVVGVGININHRQSDFPPELSSLATSLHIATGKTHSRPQVLAEFLYHLESEYSRYIIDGLAPVQERLRRLSSLIGRHIKLASGRHVIEAEVLDIDTDGRLVIRTDEGIRAVTSGEVTIVKE